MPLFGLNFPWDQPAKKDVLNLQHDPVSEEFKKIMLQYDPSDSEVLALVLCGGGLLGAHEFAKIYRLWELGVLSRVKLIVGTSVGALNAMLTAKFITDMDKALAVWAGITKDTDVYDGQLDGELLHVLGALWAAKTGAPSFLAPRGLYKLIDKLFKDMYLDSFGDRLAVITTASRLSDGKDLVYQGHYDAALCTKMSSAMWPGFPAIKGPDGLVMDGGLGNNMPVETAIRAGATKVILIGCSPDKPTTKEPKNQLADIAACILPNVFAKFEDRVWDWVEEYNQDPSNATVEFLKSYPAKDLGNALSAKETHDRIRDGYKEACAEFTPEAIAALLLK